MTVWDELKARGLIAQVTDEEEIKEMVNNGKATFYIGFDPTADSLHVGHFMALCLMKHRMLFFPISWREEDQVSNNNLTSFGVRLLKLCGRYLKNKNEIETRVWREKPIEEYTSTIIASNL